ncbi:MAG TPA: hypothetical protein PLB36_07430 [Bacillota bacterium]|nr:hypothetical protein [Bacillota bacterium]HOL12687.1 hypothetical protein [Bacillota bacterium]HPP61580.1 hypothetical protein [Bacillota bacterium]HPZ78641.1 hypothetical protein [Bacillota bacterium]
MLAKMFRTIAVVLLICGLVICVSGCSTVKPVALDEEEVPYEIRELAEKRFSEPYCHPRKTEYYVWEPEGDGYFLIGIVEWESATISGYIFTDMIFGLFKETTDEEGNPVWTGRLHNGQGSTGFSPDGIAATASFSTHKFGADCWSEYAVGWVKNPKVTKIEVVQPENEGAVTFTAKIKNGFWWAGPYEWRRQHEMGNPKVYAYSKSGKVLYKVNFDRPSP